MKRLYRYSLTLALLLLAINFYGVLFGTYNPPAKEIWGMGENDRIIETLDAEDLNRIDGEDDDDYFTRITKQLDDYLIHGPSKMTAVWDNYFLWLHDAIRVNNQYFHENLDIERGLKKGTGLCSQHSKILFSVLRENGYDSRILHLSGHVATAVLDRKNNWYILDSNYGVIIPSSIEEIENDPSQITEYYEASYRDIPPVVQLPMQSLYETSENNRLADPTVEEGWKIFYFEVVMNYLKWLFPFVLLILSLWGIKNSDRAKP